MLSINKDGKNLDTIKKGSKMMEEKQMDVSITGITALPCNETFLKTS